MQSGITQGTAEAVIHGCYAGLAASGSGGSGQLMTHLSSGSLGMAAEPRSLPTLGEAPDLLV